MIRLSDMTHTEREALAASLAKAGAILGCNTAEHTLAALYYGDGLDLTIGQSLRMVQRVQQRTCLTADGVASLVRQHPQLKALRIQKWTDDACEIIAERADGSTHTARATIEQARKRGLVRDRSPWVTHPGRMLMITAMRELRAVLFPDVGGDSWEPAEDVPTPAEHAQADAGAVATPLERAQARVAEPAPEPAPAPARTFRDALADAEQHEPWRAWRTSLPPAEADHLRTFLRGLGDEDRADVTAAADPGAALLYLAQSAGIGQTAPAPAPAPAPATTKRTAKEVANVVRHLHAAELLTDEETSALLTPGVIPRTGLDLADDDTADAATLRALLPTGDPT